MARPRLDPSRPSTAPANDIVALMSAPVSAAIFQVARNHKAYAAHLLRALDLHPGQEILLMELTGTTHRTQGELVRTLGLDHSTVAKSLRRLEDAGLVVRRPSEADRRVVMVSLTDDGAALALRVQAVWEQLEHTTTTDLTREQRRTLIELASIVERSVARALRPEDADAGALPLRSTPPRRRR